MNKPKCPYCVSKEIQSGFRRTVRCNGSYYRTSDRKWVRKFRCLTCLKYFSTSSTQACKRQLKRQINNDIKEYLASGVSQRRIARLLRISRTTVARKLVFLGAQAERNLEALNRAHPPAEVVEFDDLETFEHTKYKPLSIPLAVDAPSRRILGFEVSQMPAKGRLAKMAFKKYGYRKDKRYEGRNRLFEKLQGLVKENALIKSDQNPHYPPTVKRYFPNATHETHKGQRGSVVGQGELKRTRYDPLFSLNHTCAMFRANVNRLFRRTWCTTKKPERLMAHLFIYADFHNSRLIPAKGGRPVLMRFYERSDL